MSSAASRVSGEIRRDCVPADASRASKVDLLLRPASVESYRADIDGLRAIAILSVIAFHAAPGLLPGGFVGVDVFFVISGFLITGIILKALIRDSFSFVDFYARRIRRIFPALIVVLLSVWALGWLKLLPDEYASLTKHIAAGSVYVSNLLLFNESGYFDPSAELKPLLHLWSLGVEEQFYIVWPLMLFVTYSWRRAQLPAMLALACASFLFNLATVKSHPAAAFYMPHARLWELALGGILAQVDLTARRSAAGSSGISNVRMSNFAAIMGLTLLCTSFIAMRSQQLFPGLLALVPVAGTMLLIAAGERAWINQRVLAYRPVVFVGLISYPLYLWHWPLLSVARIVSFGELQPSMAIGAVAAAFLLAVVTYRYIEVPLRRFRSLPRTAAALFACMGVIGLLGAISFKYRLEPLSSHYGVDAIVSARTPHALDGAHLQRVKGFWVQGSGPRTILFMGDSNMEQYYPRIDELLTRDSKQGNTAVFATGGGCPPIPGLAEAHHAYCDGLVARAMAYANHPEVDTIVIGAAWHSYFYDPDERYSYYFSDGRFRGALLPDSEAAWRALGAFDAMLKRFESAHKRVFVVLQIPVGDQIDPRRMIERGMTTLSFRINVRPLSRSSVTAAVAAIDSQLTAIARREGAVVIDPVDTLCGPVECPTVDANGNPIYLDGGHLRPAYVRNDVHFLDDVMSPAGVASAELSGQLADPAHLTRSSPVGR
jgi:peptidoglycan/LPS O-acetylase OafA/YrhL